MNQMTFLSFNIIIKIKIVMIYRVLAVQRNILSINSFRFSKEHDKVTKKMIQEDQQQDSYGPETMHTIKIQQKYHKKTSELYDRYMQVREKPIACHDGKLLAYEFVIERQPIFVPFHPKSFETYRNRYVYAKKTGFYAQIPKDLKLQNGDEPFKQYDEINEENAVSHQIVLTKTEKINYRENSRVWKHADPNIIDNHSIQTYSSNSVFLIVKQQGKWIFPTKILNQKDNHSNIFNFMATHLFQNTGYPIVHFPSKKPISIRTATLEGQEKQARVLTFYGISAFGLPKFPTNMYQDFAWVPKPLLSSHFQDSYHEQTAWAATHSI